VILVVDPDVDTGPVRYVLPGPFDWGLTKPHGELILLASGLGYLACLAVSLMLLRQVWVRGCPFLAALTAGVAVVPMALMALLSVGMQLMSTHHQEDVHVPALVTVAASCLAVAAVRGRCSWAAPLPRRAR
jgi:hypothetical protein